MSILRLNATSDGLELHGSAGAPGWAIRRAARGTGPMIVLVHGYKYDPARPANNPHSTIFAAANHAMRADYTHWPRHLGFGLGNDAEGLAVAVGWRARGTLWQAQRRAVSAGRHLARAIRLLHKAAPHRPVHVITHSMGSEVAFEALQSLPEGVVGRLITLTGASYRSRAETAMRSPAGRTAELINVVTRENDIFDLMYERLVAPPRRHDTVIGAGLDLPNAVTLQLDCPATLLRLEAFGAHIAKPARRICHWSGYARPGALRFYKRLLRQPGRLSLSDLQNALPRQQSPRWSRLVSFPRGTRPLPSFEKATS